LAELTDFVRRHRWSLTVGFGLLLLVAYHAVWLYRMRDGFAVDIDEAGYLMIAFNNLDALHAEGLSGLWDSYTGQYPHAPLVSLLAVPFLEVREGILPAFGVEWLALLIVGAATYGLGRTVMPAPWAALATLTVLAMPGVVNYTREFSFALPCAAAFTVSLFALARSRNFSSLPYALAWGAAAGLAALSRTMALGLLPGLIMAAVLWAALVPPENRRNAAINLGLGIAAGLAVAASWYAKNMDSVMDYLTGFGYGNQASEYGVEQSWLSLDRWTRALTTITQQELFAPLLYASAVIVLVGIGFGIHRLLQPDRKAFGMRVLRSPAMPVTVFVVAGYLALTSTTNAGSAFALPILPGAIILLVGLASRFRPNLLRTTVAAVLLIIAVVQLLVFAQIGQPYERLRHTEVPLLGHVPVTDPRPPVVAATANVQNELRFGDADRGWIEAGAALVTAFNEKAEEEGRTPVVVLGNRDIVLNTNLLNLSARISDQPRFPLGQVTPDNGDDAATYSEFLSDPASGLPNLLLTSANEFRDYEPLVDQSEFVEAARRTGFRPFERVIQPNGEKLTLWWLERGPAIPSAPTEPVPPVQPADRKKEPVPQ